MPPKRKIKDGTLIHCKTLEELEHLIRYTGSKQTLTYSKEYCYLIENGEVFQEFPIEYCKGSAIVEFADLILAEEPELTIDEILNICHQICAEVNGCHSCPMKSGNCFKSPGENYEKLEEICKQWKTNHERKEPEVEWVDLCRIKDGNKECVYEEEIEKVLPFGGYEKDEIEKIFKRYCMEHEGNFFAVYEIVCRVKARKES